MKPTPTILRILVRAVRLADALAAENDGRNVADELPVADRELWDEAVAFADSLSWADRRRLARTRLYP